MQKEIKKITIEEIIIENFKGIKSLKINFSKKSKVSGMNATGKTSINDAFTWVMFNKNSQGAEKFDIRPIDKFGKNVDFIDIKCELKLKINGSDVVIEKLQKQNWVTKRGTATQELAGNVNEYKWNSEPISEKVFKENIKQIIDEDLFKQITNPLNFPNMKWQLQRETLMNFATGITDTDIQKTNVKFLELNLKDHTADGLLLITKDIIGKLKKTQLEIPARIDEATRRIVDVDIAELELQKNAIKEQITEISDKETDFKKVLQSQSDINLQLMELEFEKTDCIKKENMEIVNKRSDISLKLNELQSKLSQLQTMLQVSIRGKENYLKMIADGNAIREKLLTERKEISERQYDPTSLICKYCGQELQEDKKQDMISKFDVAKKEDLERNKSNGLANKESLDTYYAEVAAFDAKIKSLETQIAELQSELYTYEQAQKEVPEYKNTSDSAEYLEILSREEELKEKLTEFDRDFYENLKTTREQAETELRQVEQKLASVQNNEETEKRIEELKEEMGSIAQQIATQEQKQFLIEEFIRTKCEMLSESINKKFSIVTFKLFDIQLNGGIKDTCECMVDGVPYSSLNNGKKIVAGLDIINSLSELYGVEAPIFIDNAESINEFNIPKIDTQLILLVVSEDRKMVIENE